MDLLFEDSWDAGSSHTWFKEYMNAKTKNEIENKFSALGDDWYQHKNVLNDAIQNFQQRCICKF